VNIAIALTSDAFRDQFDTALLVSGDSDLTGPVLQIKQLFPAKRIVVAFPPARSSARPFRKHTPPSPSAARPSRTANSRIGSWGARGFT